MRTMGTLAGYGVLAVVTTIAAGIVVTARPVEYAATEQSAAPATWREITNVDAGFRVVCPSSAPRTAASSMGVSCAQDNRRWLASVSATPTTAKTAEEAVAALNDERGSAAVRTVVLEEITVDGLRALLTREESDYERDAPVSAGGERVVYLVSDGVRYALAYRMSAQHNARFLAGFHITRPYEQLLPM